MADTGYDECGTGAGTVSDNLGFFFSPLKKEIDLYFICFWQKQANKQTEELLWRGGAGGLQEGSSFWRRASEKAQRPQGWERSFSISWRLEKERTMDLISR